MDYVTLDHPFPPLYDEHAEILILGSFPSVKSREQNFFYGHPRNRFWRVIAALYGKPVPETIPEKKALILSSHLALWDVIARCDIRGSSDSSIRNVTVNDLSDILGRTRVGHRIYTNGAAANRLYMKYTYPKTGIPAGKLPSTSPANAACRLDELIRVWGEMLGVRPADKHEL